MSGLRAGVIGAGVFGGYHAQKYAGDARVDLVAVFDIDAGRADALADMHGARAYTDFSAFIDAVDVATVVGPASTHGPAARALLDAGKHVLIEKPIAVRMADADAIVRAADAGQVVQIGHQERFVARAMGLFDAPEAPSRIEARRMGPFSERGSDVSVTLDLMTHDLDLANALAGAPAVSATGEIRREKTVHPDRVDAEVRYANGCLARLTASRLHGGRDRVMRLEYPSGVVEVDFVAKSFSNTTPFDLDPNFADHPDAKDSLGAGVRAFISAVRGEGQPACTAKDGREALRLALTIDGVLADA